MPVDPGYHRYPLLIQREQYAKGGLGRWYWDFRDRIIFNFIESDDQDILDLGCGEGITLERLIKNFPGKNIQGIDVMPENVAICESFQLPARLGNVYHLECRDSSQDVVLFLEVLEHLSEPEIAIREIYRILRPGGRVLFLFPNDRTFFLSRLITLRFREAFYDPGHVRQWTISDMAHLLPSLGFQILESKIIPFYFWAISLHGLVVAIKKN
jgi:ubiquinone/menaquinone biosynthesis C-methylase UbiE